MAPLLKATQYVGTSGFGMMPDMAVAMDGSFKDGQVPFPCKSLVLKVVRFCNPELFHRATMLENHDPAKRGGCPGYPETIFSKIGERAILPLKGIAECSVREIAARRQQKHGKEGKEYDSTGSHGDDAIVNNRKVKSFCK